ncbi:hypothetical protein [Empedobacter falsenii]|uniref:DUF6712 family protein n=1 Tax=Empedobacter falsenii TaxID=343874 RepID=UPI003A8068E1
MYRINYLQREVLITPDEIIFHIATASDVDVRLISNSIINAEERFIRPALGDDFYEEFIDSKNITVTSANQAELLSKINENLIKEEIEEISAKDLPIGSIVNSIDFIQDEHLKKLWFRHLWKLTAECVDAMTTIPSWLKHNASGQQQQNPKTIGGNNENAASGGIKDVQYKIDSAINTRIEPLLSSMNKWLCKNKANYPLFEADCGDCKGGQHSVSTSESGLAKSNIVTGIYDE